MSSPFLGGMKANYHYMHKIKNWLSLTGLQSCPFGKDNYENPSWYLLFAQERVEDSNLNQGLLILSMLLGSRSSGGGWKATRSILRGLASSGSPATATQPRNFIEFEVLNRENVWIYSVYFSVRYNYY